jgi:hypothetical protein
MTFYSQTVGFGTLCSYFIQGRADYSLEGQEKSGAGIINCLSANLESCFWQARIADWSLLVL